VHQLDPDVEDRNYAKEPLTQAEIQKILKAVSSTADVLNTQHKTAKAKGWKEKAPSKSAFAAAAAVENNLLRRPITLTPNGIVVGRDLDAIRDLLGASM